jgi:transcriptional regulator with XRE-family HTH domain
MGKAPRPLLEEFGARITDRRGDLGMSREALGRLTNMHSQSIAAIEWGEKNVRIGTLIRLAGGLGLSPADLMRGLTWEARRRVWVGGGFYVIGDDGSASAVGPGPERTGNK